MQQIFEFLKNESGATAMEYGLIAALVSVAVVAGYTQLGNGLEALFGANNDGAGAAISSAAEQLE